MMKSHTLDVNVKFSSKDIDDQHREIAETMARFCRQTDTSDEQQAAEALEEFVQFLNSYFLFHTFTEEKLMYDNHYPRDEYFRHVREHKEVILDMVNLLDGQSATHRLQVTATNPRERAHQLMNSFNHWLHDHIETADSKLTEFLKAKGL